MGSLYSVVNVSAFLGLKSLVPQNRGDSREGNFHIIIITELIVRDGCKEHGSENPCVPHIRIAMGMRSF
jgi:hypothetical protein